jgi:hypothetical protein
MVTPKRRYSKEIMAQRGDALYDGTIGPQFTEKDVGKFVAIDIETGDFAVDADELKACHKLRARIPDAQIWMVRIGYRAVHRFGGRDVRREIP